MQDEKLKTIYLYFRRDTQIIFNILSLILMKNLRFSLIAIICAFIAANGFGSDCNTASTLTPGLSLSHKVFSKSLSGEGFSGGAQCEGPGNRPDSWMKFNAESPKMFVRAKGAGDLDLALEILESCSGNLLACVNQTGAGANETVNLTGLTVGNTYYIKAYHAGEQPAQNHDFTISVAYIPTVSLQQSDCGITDYTTNDIIKSTQPPGYIAPIVYYQWKFEELDPPYNVYEKVSPNLSNPHFRLFWFNQIEFGRSYNVSVRIAVNPGATLGEYGPVCTIKMDDEVTPTQLEEQYQSAIIGFCDVVSADKVAGAEKYRWELHDYSTGITHVAYGDNDQRTLRISKVPDLSLGTPYFIRVYAMHKGQQSGEGTLRWLNTNNQVPNTGLNTEFHPCGETYPINKVVQAYEICNAESYTWRFKNLSQPSLPDLIYTRVGGNRSIILNWVNGLIVGDTYSVQVKGRQGNKNGDYSAACNITIGEKYVPGLHNNDYLSFIQSDDSFIEEEIFEIEEAEAQLEVVVLNNGTSTNQNVVFEITPKNFEGNSQIALYDINGRLVANKTEYLNINGNRVEWNIPGFTSGIYFLRVTNEVESVVQKVFLF